MQYGFRKGRRVEDAWMYVQRAVWDNVNEYVLGVYIIFKGAFDYLGSGDWTIEGAWLYRNYSLPQQLLAQKSLHRWNECECGGWGGPQGSICGSCIWNPMMDSLLGHLEPLCRCCAYADEVLFFF